MKQVSLLLTAILGVSAAPAPASAARVILGCGLYSDTREWPHFLEDQGSIDAMPLLEGGKRPVEDGTNPQRVELRYQDIQVTVRFGLDEQGTDATLVLVRRKGELLGREQVEGLGLHYQPLPGVDGLALECKWDA